LEARLRASGCAVEAARGSGDTFSWTPPLRCPSWWSTTGRMKPVSPRSSAARLPVPWRV